MNFKERSHFHYDIVRKNLAIAKKIQEMKSRLPDKEEVKKMVKAHDNYRVLASHHKGTLPSLDPLIRRKISIESQYMPLIDAPLQSVHKSNRPSMMENLWDNRKPGHSAFTKSPSEQSLIADLILRAETRRKSATRITPKNEYR